MGKKLRANADYENGPRKLHYRRGEEFEASDDLMLFLMADAPGCFEVVTPLAPVEPPAKALDAPPNDKMLRKPKAKK